MEMNRSISQLDNTKSLLKANDVAKVLNISKTLAYSLMRKGEIRTVKIRGVRRVREKDLDKFIENSLDY
jgi:excisionase family DNA binding protein